jgi:hypothetical protein
MKKSHEKRSFLPSAEKIDRGIFIDVEGFAKNSHRLYQPPVLIGVLRRGKDGVETFEQVVFNEAYRYAAEDPGVAHRVRFEPDRVAYLRELLASSRRSAPLFAFSEHELDVLERETGVNPAPRYRNVRTIAKRWLRRHAPQDRVLRNASLFEIATAMGHPMPEKLPRGGVTAGLRKTATHAKSAKKWHAAPDDVRFSWQQVLEHNRADVRAIKALMAAMAASRQIAHQLEAAEAS